MCVCSTLIALCSASVVVVGWWEEEEWVEWKKRSRSKLAAKEPKARELGLQRVTRSVEHFLSSCLVFYSLLSSLTVCFASTFSFHIWAFALSLHRLCPGIHSYTHLPLTFFKKMHIQKYIWTHTSSRTPNLNVIVVRVRLYVVCTRGKTQSLSVQFFNSRVSTLLSFGHVFRRNPFQFSKSLFEYYADKCAPMKKHGIHAVIALKRKCCYVCVTECPSSMLGISCRTHKRNRIKNTCLVW